MKEGTSPRGVSREADTAECKKDGEIDASKTLENGDDGAAQEAALLHIGEIGQQY
jgi:hypothetical protein